MLGNRELIGQAIANLIDNALKYGAADLGSARRTRSTSRRGARARNIVIEVADHGAGRRRKPIASACSTVSCGWKGARSRPGSGLGLSLGGGGRAHAWRLRAARGQSPGLEGRRHAAGGRGCAGAAARRRLNAPLADRLVAAPRCGSIALARRRLEALLQDAGVRACAAKLRARKPVRDLLLGLADHSPYLWSLIDGGPGARRPSAAANRPRPRSTRLIAAHRGGTLRRTRPN